MIKKLHYLLLFLFLGQPVLSQEGGVLYYTGLAENGWQVYRWDFQKKKETRLTNSPGDKRAPTWVSSLGKIVYKDARGQICAVDLSGEEEILIEGVLSCAHFTVSRDGKHVYYTRLLANNPLRQSLWHASSENDFRDPQLIFRMPRGSIRNVCLSPSGMTIAMSHVWRDNEERILVLDLDALSKDPTITAQPITPEFITAAFPRYNHSGKTLYFTKRVERGNYDLCAYSFTNKKSSVVFATPTTSEFYPYPSADGRWLFYEARENAGNAISVYDTQKKSHRLLELPRPAKEPCYIDAK